MILVHNKAEARKFARLIRKEGRDGWQERTIRVVYTRPDSYISYTDYTVRELLGLPE